MANARDVHTGNGTQTDFVVSFPYIEQGDVFVTVAGVATTAFTWIAANTIRFTSTPADGAVIVITRDSLANGRKVDYAPGSLTEQDLDTDSLQGFYAAQEAEDRVGLTVAVNSEDHWDAQGKRMVALADPVSAQDAATKAYVDSVTGGVPAAQAAAEAAQSAAEAAETTAVAAAGTASAAQAAAEAARDQAVAAADSLDLSPYATIAYTDGAINTFAAQLPGGLADRLRWLEVNLALNTLRDAIDAGWTTLAMVDGFADEFNDESGVDTGTSTGHTYDAAGDFYTSAPTVPVSGASGTPIGDMVDGGGLASGFDGVTNQAHTAGPAKNSGSQPGLIGKDWGVGVTKTIVSAQVHSSNSVGFWGGGDTTINFRLLGSSENNAGTATVLGTASIADGNNISVTITATVLSAFRYHWVEISVPSLGVYCAECVFSERVGTNMALVSDAFTAATAPVSARAVLLVDPLEAVTLNTDLIVEISRDDGVTWTAGTLAYEADYDQNVQILATDEIDLTGQPAATAVRVRLRTPTNKAIRVHAWTAQWR